MAGTYPSPVGVLEIGNEKPERPRRRAASRRLVALSAATVCVSAALLFSVQLLFVKTILPQFGGTPAVWNTAVFFFQTLLLGGYFYAHLIRTYLSLRNQILLHATVVLSACAFLPVHVVKIFERPDVSGIPIAVVLATLTAGVGLPFFALSATSPLLQSWLTQTKHQDGEDPYFLSAASNAGSMLGLLAYPLVLEPFLGLQTQSRVWTGGYLLLLALLALSALTTWRNRRENAPASKTRMTDVAASAPLRTKRKLLWVGLACVPSSLMLGVATYLSTAIAPIPMLWMLPLATYLATLIIAFSRMSKLSLRLVSAAPLYAATALILCMAALHKPFLVLWLIWLHMTIFFALALSCHKRLVEERPGAAHLTEFYLWLSVGGALGGLFNALIAPVVFSNIFEYPLALCAAIAFEKATPPRSAQIRQWLNIIFYGAAATDLAIIALWFPLAVMRNATMQHVLLASTAIACLSAITHPRRLALSIGMLFWVGTIMQDARGSSLFSERDFFGVKEVSSFVVSGSPWPAHKFIHSGTVHGIESYDPALLREPLGYYSVFPALEDALRHEHPIHNVGVTGLGVGTLACGARPNEQWTFYEIDPEVVRIARDSRYFSYLSLCAPRSAMVIGDARLSLLRESKPRYDVMVFDAYSSDQAPVHLLTREALRVYRANLAKSGVLLFHISNRNFDLRGVLGNLAADAGLAAYIFEDLHPKGVAASLKLPSIWVAMAEDPRRLVSLPRDQRWKRLPRFPDLPLWTDDYSSLIRVLKR